jgi:pyruvate formate lyase activating enzyme
MSCAAPVFDVQTLAIHDGPGIRTVLFLKGCPLRCSWCCNPEGQRLEPELRWRGARCSGCLACVDGCRAGAVAVRDGRPLFQRQRCVVCQDRPCLAACPTGALDLVGALRGAAALWELLRRDLRLFWNTGGGVTFGGGEPLLHPRLIVEIAGRLRAVGASAVLETCGLWSLPEVTSALDACSLVYFDLKALDDDAHRRCTGASNAPILHNLARLLERRADSVVVSLPLVPGLLDSRERASAAGRRLVELGARRVRLLPYHRLGEGKYASLGRPVPEVSGAPITATLVAEVRDDLLALGLDVRVDSY